MKNTLATNLLTIGTSVTRTIAMEKDSLGCEQVRGIAMQFHPSNPNEYFVTTQSILTVYEQISEELLKKDIYLHPLGGVQDIERYLNQGEVIANKLINRVKHVCCSEYLAEESVRKATFILDGLPIGTLLYDHFNNHSVPTSSTRSYQITDRYVKRVDIDPNGAWRIILNTKWFELAPAGLQNDLYTMYTIVRVTNRLYTLLSATAFRCGARVGDILTIPPNSFIADVIPGSTILEFVSSEPRFTTASNTVDAVKKYSSLSFDRGVTHKGKVTMA